MGLHFYLGDCPPRASGGALIGNMTQHVLETRPAPEEDHDGDDALLVDAPRRPRLLSTLAMWQVSEGSMSFGVS